MFGLNILDAVPGVGLQSLQEESGESQLRFFEEKFQLRFLTHWRKVSTEIFFLSGEKSKLRFFDTLEKCQLVIVSLPL